MPLTDIQVRSAKPREKTYKLFDGRGLYLEVAPSGGKWWRFKYRFNDKEKRLSLGVYPDVSLKDAREKCEDTRRQVAAGIDPSEHKKAQKAARAEVDTDSFEVVAREWYAKYSTVWVPSHGVRIIRRLERDIFPWIGRRPVGELTAPELLVVIRRIEERGAIETAHRALSNCGQVLRYAVATGRAVRDPSSDLNGALVPVKPTHFPAPMDAKRIGQLLNIMDGHVGSIVVRCALRLAPLVFVRPGELRTAKWDDIDFKAAEWRFTVTKTDTAHIVPLSSQALAILNEVHPVTGEGIYVFPSARSKSRPMSDNAILMALRTLEIPKDELTGHGFRAIARTHLDEVLGFRPDFIEHQLAHAVKDPNGRAYNRTAHLVERKKMMQAWADYLDRLKKALY